MCERRKWGVRHPPAPLHAHCTPERRRENRGRRPGAPRGSRHMAEWRCQGLGEGTCAQAVPTLGEERTCIVTDLSRRGLRAFPAAVMHPRLRGKEGAIPTPPSSPGPYHSSDRMASWTAAPTAPPGPQQVPGGQRCAPSRTLEPGVCMRSTSSGNSASQPKPGPPGLPAQGACRTAPPFLLTQAEGWGRGRGGRRGAGTSPQCLRTG